MKIKQGEYSSLVENDKIIFKKNTSGQITTVLLSICAMIIAVYFTRETAKTVSFAVFVIISVTAIMSSLPFQIEVESTSLKIKYKLFPYKLFPGFIRTKLLKKDELVSIVTEPKVVKLFSEKSFRGRVGALTTRKKIHTLFTVELESMEAVKKEVELLAIPIAKILGISVQPISQNNSALTSHSS